MKGYIKRAAVTAAALLIAAAAVSGTAVMADPTTDSSPGTGTSTDIGTGTGTEIAPVTQKSLTFSVDTAGNVSNVMIGNENIDNYTVSYDILTNQGYRTIQPSLPGTYKVTVFAAYDNEIITGTIEYVLITDVKIDVSANSKVSILSRINIYPDRYEYHPANGEEKFSVPYTGGYTFTGTNGGYNNDNPIQFINDNDTESQAEFNVNFDDLTLNASSSCSCITFEESDNPITLNINCTGENTVKGGNFAAFTNRSGKKVTLNINAEDEGASFSFGRKDGISTETLYQQNNTSSEVECTLNGTSVGPQGTKFTSIDLPDGYTGNYTYTETSKYANNYTFDPNKVIPEFKATIINPADKYFTLLTEDKKAVGATTEPESGYIAESAHIAGIKPAKLEKGQIIKVDDTVSTYRSEFYIQEFPESTKINAFGMNTTREDYVDYSDYEFDLKCGTAQVRDTIYNDYTMGSGGASIITAKKADNAEGIGIFVADGNGSYADPYEFDELLRYSPTQDAPVWSEDLHEGDEFVIYGAEGKTVSVSDKTDVIVLESDTEFDVVFDNGTTERAVPEDGKYTFNCPNDRYITSVKKANSYLVVFGSIVKATVGNKEYSKIFTLSESKDVTFTSERFFRVKMGNTVTPAEKNGDVYTLTVSVTDNVNVYDTSFYIGQQFFAEDGAEYVVYQGEKYYYNYVNTAQPFDFYGSVSQSETDEKVFQIAKVKFVADGSRYNFMPIKPEENDSNKVMRITESPYKNGIGVYLESGNGTASAPYDFKELFEYKIVNGTADSYVTIADLHAGDRITDGNITAEVRNTDNGNVTLWCDHTFYIKTEDTGYTKYEVNGHGFATVTLSPEQEQIKGFSAYDQSVSDSNGCVNLSLDDGTIGFNLYYRVAAADANGAYIQPSGTKIPLYTLDTVTKDNVDYYVYKMTVPAKNIADEFDPNVYKADDTRLNLGFGEGNVSAYSVAKAYYDNAASYDSTNAEKLKNLAKALINYGHWAHKYFYPTEETGIDTELIYKDSASGQGASGTNNHEYDIAASAIHGYNVSKTLPDTIVYKYCTLSLKDKTRVNLYLTNNTGADLEFALVTNAEGVTLSFEKLDNNVIKVTVSDIKPQYLKEWLNVTITGENVDTNGTVQFGFMPYANSMLQKYNAPEGEKQPMYYLMCSMYYYFQYAKEYIGG
ncbi:MAG: hypothetical protein IJ149_00810 [Oscillospiraceae bacterium]|nr:hypothetical protein [Oscillospiraceae bacterium]